MASQDLKKQRITPYMEDVEHKINQSQVLIDELELMVWQTDTDVSSAFLGMIDDFKKLKSYMIDRVERMKTLLCSPEDLPTISKSEPENEMNTTSIIDEYVNSV